MVFILICLLHATRFPTLRIHVSSSSLLCAFFHLLCTVSGSLVPSRFERFSQNSSKSAPIRSLKNATTLSMSVTYRVSMVEIMAPPTARLSRAPSQAQRPTCHADRLAKAGLC